MKRLSTLIVTGLCLLAGFGGANNLPTEIPNTVNNAAAESAGLIGEEAAKKIALDHAGISESRVVFIKVQLDYDDGKTEYDVEFHVDQKEYDCEIDAYSGAVVSYDFDVENHPKTKPSSNDTTASNQTQSSTMITTDAAKKIALEHVGLAEDTVTFIKAKLDRDDGRTVYDIEFHVDNKEYDYEIDAYSGAVVSYDFDIENYVVASQNNDKTASASGNEADSNKISLEEAKKIALDKAGLSESKVTYKETSFEYDDGIAVYQIEFISGTLEYETEINATTGAIVEYEVESVYD